MGSVSMRAENRAFPAFYRWVARQPRRTSVTVRTHPQAPLAPPLRPLPDRDSPHFLQQLRAFLKPANSGRNAFARAWKKQRQIQVQHCAALVMSCLRVMSLLDQSLIAGSLLWVLTSISKYQVV